MPDPLLAELDRVQGSRGAKPAGGDPLLAMLDDVQSRPVQDDRFDAAQSEPTLTERVIPLALRVGGAIAGGIAGGTVAAPTVLGIPAGILAGGAAGSGAGEVAAQAYERWKGQRDDFNPTQVAVQTALGGVPMGRAFGSTVPGIVASRGAQGALLGGSSTVATQLAETGELPSPGQVGVGAGLGAVLGGAGGAVEGRAVTRRAARPTARRPVAALPSGPRFRAAPDGRIAAGVDIPMSQAPDGSFVRGIPAEYARHEVAGLLEAGPSFVAGPRGVAATSRADDVLALLDDVQGARAQGPDPSGVQSTRAAVLERDVDPTVRGREGLRVRQYASDPDAVDAPVLSDGQRQQLTRMRRDLQEFAPERGRLIWNKDHTEQTYAYGGPGSPVGDDIRVISEQHVGNREIAQAIDDLLAGKTPTNRLHTAAMDAAQGYIEKRPGYRGPIMPMDVAIGGGEPVGAVADDFERFSRMFDDVEPGVIGGGREPGQEGFIAPLVAARLGGAAGGAAVGAATGEDTEDRIGRALMFGAAGAAAPSLLRGRAPGVVARAPQSSGNRVPGIVSSAGRMGQPNPDPLAGTDVFVAKFSNPLVREGIRERLAQNAGYADQRRGVISSEELGRLADEVRINVEKTLPKGTALNAEQITGYARGLAATQRRVSDLAAKVNTVDASDADRIALLAAKADADVLTKSLMGARAEAGRALAAFNLYQSVLETGNVTLVRDVLHGPGVRREAERLAQQIAQLPDDSMSRYTWLRTQRSSSLMEKARSVYYANILSGVKTHERNILGNVANLTAALVTHPVAAGVDAVRSAVTKAPRAVRLEEMPAQVVGAVAGIDRGFRDAAFTLRHGVSPDRLTRTVDAAAGGTKFDVPRVEFAGGAGNPFNWPGRALDAGDVFFRSIARNLEMYGLAHTAAKNEGLTGQRFVDRVAELRAGVTPEGQAIKAQAETFATRAVFQEQPGEITQIAQRLVRAFPPASLVVPFIKTPSNIMRQGLEFSPAGVLMNAARHDGRAGAQAQARVALGTTAAGFLFWLAASGRLSGNGPRDPHHRATLMESGWRPNSVRVGDSWVSFQLMQPLSVQMAVVGNAAEAWREAGGDPDNSADVVVKTLAKSAGSFLDQSFLSGLFDFVEAVNDPERWASRWGGRTASSAIPFTAAVRTVQQAVDPVVRQPRSIPETIKSGIPGLSTDVQPRISRFGQPVVRDGGPLRRAVDPFNVSSVVDDPIDRELQRLGVSVSLPSDRLVLPAGRTLTSEQKTDVKQQRGQSVRRALGRLMADQRYARLDDPGRVRAIERLVPRVRARATAALRRVPAVIAPAGPGGSASQR